MVHTYTCSHTYTHSLTHPKNKHTPIYRWPSLRACILMYVFVRFGNTIVWPSDTREHNDIFKCICSLWSRVPSMSDKMVPRSPTIQHPHFHFPCHTKNWTPFYFTNVWLPVDFYFSKFLSALAHHRCVPLIGLSVVVKKKNRNEIMNRW